MGEPRSDQLLNFGGNKQEILLLLSQVFNFSNAPNTTAEVKFNKASNTGRGTENILC